MHGGLSKDMKVEVKNGMLNEKNQIDKKIIEEYIKGSLKSDLEDIIRISKG